MEKIVEIATTGNVDQIYFAIEKIINGRGAFTYEDLVPPLKILFDISKQRGLDVQSPNNKYTLGDFLAAVFQEEEENDQEAVLRIHSLLLVGMSSNIMVCRGRSELNGKVFQEAEEPLPLLIAAIKYRMFSLVDHIFSCPDLIITPEMLNWVNSQFEPIDRVRETMLSRLRGTISRENMGEGARKRSRYELEDIDH